MAEAIPRNPGQPFTLGGVARYAQARPARLLGMALLFGLLGGISFAALFAARLAPVIREAVAHLPENSAISQGVLFWPEDQGRLLAANAYLSISAGTETFDEGAPVDFVVLFGARQWHVRSLLGMTSLPYPAAWQVELNRGTLLPLWGAWGYPLIPLIAAGTALLLMGAWFLLAIPYTVVVRFFALVLRKHPSFRETWKISVAAQWPGAILVTFMTALYTAGQTGLALLLLAQPAHFVLTFLYLVFAPICLPRDPDNPFATEVEPKGRKRPRKNPFA